MVTYSNGNIHVYFIYEDSKLEISICKLEIPIYESANYQKILALNVL